MPAVPKPIHERRVPKKEKGLKRSGIKNKPKAKKEPNPLKLVDHNRKNDVPADFPKPVRRVIIARDEGRCVYRRADGKRCARKVEGIHHVIFKSHGGLGTVDNGVLVCGHHHRWAHGRVKLEPNEAPEAGRRYFEQYRINHLLTGRAERTGSNDQSSSER